MSSSVSMQTAESGLGTNTLQRAEWGHEHCDFIERSSLVPNSSNACTGRGSPLRVVDRTENDPPPSC
jgi:hypothetical protein